MMPLVVVEGAGLSCFSGTVPDSDAASCGGKSCSDVGESEPRADDTAAFESTWVAAGGAAAADGQSRAHSSSVSLSTRLQCLSKALQQVKCVLDSREDENTIQKSHKKHGTRHTSHVTRHMSHVTRHKSHVTRHTSHVTRHTSKVNTPRHLIKPVMTPRTPAGPRVTTQTRWL